MRKYYLLITLGSLLSACAQNSSVPRVVDPEGEKAREAVISFSENYFKFKLKDARLFTDEDGLITITNDLTGYKINQPKIVIGLIDEDENIDAVVPFYTLRGQTVMDYYHMILLSSADTFKVVKTMNDVFNLLGIRNRKIFAEVSTVSPDSPGYGCDECKEVVSFSYRNGDLVRVE